MATVQAAQHYELLDFGDGRKLERFGRRRAESALPGGGGRRQSRGPSCGPRRRRGFAGRGRAMARGRRIRKQWMPAEWHFVHDGEAAFRLAARSVAVGAGGRVSGAARELGLDCAAGGASEIASGDERRAAGAESVCVHGRQHAGGGGGRGGSRAHRCGPQHRRPRAAECGAFRSRRAADSLDRRRRDEVLPARSEARQSVRCGDPRSAHATATDRRASRGRSASICCRCCNCAAS